MTEHAEKSDAQRWADYKAKQRAYHQAYRQRPEVKAKRRAYQQRPEVKASKQAYQQAYWQRPEVKAKHRAFQQRVYALARAAITAGLDCQLTEDPLSDRREDDHAG